MKGGRKPRSGDKSSITRRDNIRAKLTHGRHWPMVRLRQCIEEKSKSQQDTLPDNYLSQRRALNTAIGREQGYVLLDEIDALWKTWSAECERAVITGDADWFQRQADAIKHGDKRTDAQKDRARFEAEIVRLGQVELRGS